MKNDDNKLDPPIVVIAGDKEYHFDDADKFQTAMDAWQDAMVEEEKRIAAEFGISEYAASLVQYLRTRSRWTPEKEAELIRIDKAGEELPNVLAGDF